MSEKSKTIQKCQISGSKDLKTIFSLGYLPPVNKLNKINSLLCEDIFFPAELVYSNKSKLVQLSTLVKKEILFPQSQWAPKSALMAAYSYYVQDYYGDAVAELDRFLKVYPNHKNIS